MKVFRALDYEFTITVDGAPAFEEYVSRLFASLHSGRASESASPWRVRPRAEDGGWELLVDDTNDTVAATPAQLVTAMVHDLNAMAIPTWDGAVCHAGAVAKRGIGIVLPAEAESGKSTLTAGLVRAGFDYVTDEGVAFHRECTLIEPYPKPLTLDHGSWHLFRELEPGGAFGRDDPTVQQWQVPPEAIRRGCVAAPSPARLIVFPRYVEGATTELAPLRRAPALVELAKNTFGFNQQSRALLEHLATVVRAVDSYRLTIGSLDDAVRLIEELVSSLPADARADG